MSDGAWMVVGLGNPGPSYAVTRHNVGHRVADLLARRAGDSWRVHKSGRGHVVEGRLAGTPGVRVVLLRPRAYMNESGGPVAALARYYRVDPNRLVVVHDELDLDLGQLRLKLGGGDNGHNGLRSVRRSLGTGDFYRVRVGIGRPPGRQDPADFVLSPFPADLRPDVEHHVERAAEAVECLLAEGLEAAQNRYNS